MERPKAEADYRNNNVKVPASLIMMNAVDYGGVGMTVTVSWFGSNGKYINGIIIGHAGNWKRQCKNF